MTCFDSSRSRAASQDLEEGDPNSVRQTGAGAYADDPVQPGIARIARLETRGRAHVVKRRVDSLAPRQRLNDVRRPVAEAEIANVDRGAVVGAHSVARIELGRAVGEDRLPVSAQIEDVSGQEIGRAHV